MPRYGLRALRQRKHLWRCPKNRCARISGLMREQPDRAFGSPETFHLQNARIGCIGMNRLAVYFDARFIDDNDRKGSISDPRIVPEPPREVFAMLDCIAGRRKFQPSSISDWYAVLHIKIESSHHVPAAKSSRRVEGRSELSARTPAFAVPPNRQDHGSEEIGRG